MRKWLLQVVVLLSIGCADKVALDDTPQLNGYWEIKQVVFPDGTTKDYTLGTTVDYIQLTGSNGFRKKVQPKIDGTFDTSNDAERFTITAQDENIQMNYKTEWSEWKETLSSLDHNTFSVINEAGIRYKYQRFEPIKVDL